MSLKKKKGIPWSWIGRIIIVKNNHTTQGNLQIQCNPYQNTNGRAWDQDGRVVGYEAHLLPQILQK